MSEQLIVLYKQISDLTAPECASTCRVPHSCCSGEYCEDTIENAATRWNTVLARTDHPRLPLMGPTGCTAAPHLRPLCTFHTCDVNAWGFKGDDPEGKWTTSYFAIRNEIEDLEFKAYQERACLSKS